MDVHEKQRGTEGEELKFLSRLTGLRAPALNED